MSKRKSPWWHAPLAQWHREAGAVLSIGHLIRGRRQRTILRGYLTNQWVIGAGRNLEKLRRDPAIERLMRQLLGQQGPRVQPIASRRVRRKWAPRNRDLLRLPLSSLAVDKDLRPRRTEFTPQWKKLLASEWKELASAFPEYHLRLQPEPQRRRDIDRLSDAQRRRICSAGFLLLITALAFEASRTIAIDHKHRRGRPPAAQDSRGDRAARQRARAVALELLNATRWLYGRPLIKPSISLVKTITAVTFTPSSMRLLARQLR